jgi:hypothetical protein
MEQIDALQQRLTALHQEHSLPWWRLAYPNFMIQRAREYHALGLSAESEMSASRVKLWLQKFSAQTAPIDAPKAEPAAVMVKTPWNQAYLQGEISRLQQAFAQRKMLLPIPERDAFQRQLNQAQQLLQSAETSAAKSIIFEVRKAWTRRMLRSQRAWNRVLLQQGESQRSFKVKGAAPGPYNSSAAIHRFTEVISERDPIWVEDMMDLYQNLFAMAEKLGIAPKKGKISVSK